MCADEAIGLSSGQKALQSALDGGEREAVATTNTAITAVAAAPGIRL